MTTRAPRTGSQDWHCAAYGPDGPTECFVDLDQPCETRTQCERRMTAVRQGVFRGIHERAARGDPTMARLSQDYLTPAHVFPDTTPDPDPDQ